MNGIVTNIYAQEVNNSMKQLVKDLGKPHSNTKMRTILTDQGCGLFKKYGNNRLCS
jgi:hypothetical protein